MASEGSDPDWAILLKSLYEKQKAGLEYPTGGGVSRYVAEDNEFVQQNTPLTTDEANQAIEYLLEIDLVEMGTAKQYV